MAIIVCARCGMSRKRGAVPGHIDLCNVCMPPPEQAREAQRLAEEADFRIRAAIRRAAEGAGPDPVPVATSVPRRRGPRARRTDVRWLIGPDPRTLAHLFGQGTPTSCCGKVAHSHRLRIAPPGKRGCRRCAYAAGFTADAAEGVTT